MARSIPILTAAGAALALIASYAGALHPAGDSLAVFRLHIAALLAVLSLPLLFGRRRIGLAGLAIAALAAAPLLWQSRAPAAASVPVPDALTLYQKNLFFVLPDTAPVIADIRAAAPDLLTLQEVTAGNDRLLDALADILPSQHRCPFAAVGGVAVAARWPALPGSGNCHGNRGLVSLRVETPAGPVTLAALHLHWPWPMRQAEQLALLLPDLRALEPPVILAGDFNMVPWSHALRTVQQATGTRRVGPVRISFPRYAPLFPLAIDHVLGPAGWPGDAALRPLFGSDHHGILARLAPPG